MTDYGAQNQTIKAYCRFDDMETRRHKLLLAKTSSDV